MSEQAGIADQINTGKTTVIDGVKISLREPDRNNFQWIGQREPLRLLMAALLKIDAADRPMNPVLIGPPGNGKTTMACVAAREYDLPLYLVNCSSDMRPEDLLVTPVIDENGRIVYRSSALVSAVVRGGVCVLDEANRMNEKCWASLAALLDDRRYADSVIAGVKIPAHPEFRLITTMNDDSSTYDIPGYIESRLKPLITIETPSDNELFEIVRSNVPYATDDLVRSVFEFLKDEDGKRLEEYSIRDAINITRFAAKLGPDDERGIVNAIKGVAGQSAHEHL